MKLNKRNLFARYYVWSTENYPNDLCSYFWSYLFLAILTITTLYPVGRLVHKLVFPVDYGIRTRNEWWIESLLAAVTYAILFIITSVGRVLLLSLGYEPGISLVGLLLAMFTGIVLFTIVIGLTCFLVIASNRRSSRSKYSDKTGYIENIGNWIGAIRGKYCTKLEWVDEQPVQMYVVGDLGDEQNGINRSTEGA